MMGWQSVQPPSCGSRLALWQGSHMDGGGTIHLYALAGYMAYA